MALCVRAACEVNKQSGDERSCSRNATHGAGDDRRAHWTGAVTPNNASERGREDLAFEGVMVCSNSPK